MGIIFLHHFFFIIFSRHLNLILSHLGPMVALSWPYVGIVLDLCWLSWAVLAYLGPILVHLSSILAVLAASWPHLDLSWPHLGLLGRRQQQY